MADGFHRECTIPYETGQGIAPCAHRLRAVQGVAGLEETDFTVEQVQPVGGGISDPIISGIFWSFVVTC